MNWEKAIEEYKTYLDAQERSAATISKYLRDVRAFCAFLADRELDKAAVVAYKEALEPRYAAASVNSMLAAVNGFTEFLGRGECRVRQLRVQRRAFLSREKELDKTEYLRLLSAAQDGKNCRLYLLMQAVCSTGIRISELRFITVQAARLGRADVTGKGKTRTIFLPRRLCRELLRYAAKHRLKCGPIFVTRSGKPIDRSNVWREMKLVCARAGVESGKVFPHNLRHLFARSYYAIDRDIAHLADLLGHSSIDTTRIYTMTSGEEQEERIAQLGLIV